MRIVWPQWPITPVSAVLPQQAYKFTPDPLPPVRRPPITKRKKS